MEAIAQAKTSAMRKNAGAFLLPSTKDFTPVIYQVTLSFAFYKHLLLSQITYGINGDVRPE